MDIVMSDKSSFFMLFTQAATKKQKYEKISEKKMSTPVEVLCKVRGALNGVLYFNGVCHLCCMLGFRQRTDWIVRVHWLVHIIYKISLLPQIPPYPTPQGCIYLKEKEPKTLFVLCRVFQLNLPCTWITVVGYGSRRPLITCTYVSCSAFFSGTC